MSEEPTVPQPSTPTRTTGPFTPARLPARGEGTGRDSAHDLCHTGRSSGPAAPRVGPMSEPLLDAYRAVRTRMCAIAAELSPSELAAVVPACPEWTVRDLLTHNVALPAAIGAGDLPGDDLQRWLDGLVERRRTEPLEELLAEWNTLDDVVGGVLSATPVLLERSEERRVGKECRSRWSPYH